MHERILAAGKKHFAQGVHIHVGQHLSVNTLCTKGASINSIFLPPQPDVNLRTRPLRNASLGQVMKLADIRQETDVVEDSPCDLARPVHWQQSQVIPKRCSVLAIVQQHYLYLFTRSNGRPNACCCGTL